LRDSNAAQMSRHTVKRRAKQTLARRLFWRGTPRVICTKDIQFQPVVRILSALIAPCVQAENRAVPNFTTASQKFYKTVTHHP
jgi:hypothetical protein